MSLLARRFALLSGVAAGTMNTALATALAIALAPAAVADPNIDTQSATAVINQLEQQGYAVTINGVPSGDAALLTTCKVTAIHKPGSAAPDPSSQPVSVDVACPIQRG